MFCRFCGTELRNEDKFCSNCGENISIDNYSEKKQGMRWYKLYIYCLYPLSTILLLFIGIFTANSIFLDKLGALLVLVIPLIFFVYNGITFAFLIFKMKIGYYMFIIPSIIGVILDIPAFILLLTQYEKYNYVQYLSALLFMALGIVNTIYFHKRKKLFN